MNNTKVLNIDICRNTLQAMAGMPIMIIGDIMLDHYVFGQVERISPEAPVPVVRVGEERRLLGGAGNVARNVASLDGVPMLFGIIGQDGESKQIQQLCGEAGFEVHAVSDRNRPTTRKTRVLAGSQQLVRIDRESTETVSERLWKGLLTDIGDRIGSIRVIIISDYGKGLVSKEFMTGLQTLINGLDERPLILVDPKIRNWDCYSGVDVLTPNTKEASEGSGVLFSEVPDVIEIGKTLMNHLNCRNLLVTLGGEGMAVFESADDVYHIPTAARKVFDVTGAGDTVIASLALALASGADLLTASALANYAAGITVGQVGAAVATREDISLALTSLPRPEVSRLK